jgi:hypothetical protein
MAQVSFKAKLVKGIIALGAIVDPALALPATVKLADGTTVVISIAAEVSRTAAGLATAMKAALPASLVPHVDAADADNVVICSLGADTISSLEVDITVTEVQTFDNTISIGLAMAAGFALG